MNTCRVNNCRFNTSHVASGHRCGKCKKFGHGEIECGNIRKISNLQKESVNDKMINETQCNIIECEYRWSHNTSAHHCQTCGEREHCTSNCRLNRNNERKVSREGGSSIFTRWDTDSILLANHNSVVEKKNENK